MECPKLELGDNIRIKEETCSNDFKCNCVVTFECDSGKGLKFIIVVIILIRITGTVTSASA